MDGLNLEIAEICCFRLLVEGLHLTCKRSSSPTANIQTSR